MIRIRVTNCVGNVLYDARLDGGARTPAQARRFIWAGIRALVEAHLLTPAALTTKMEIEVMRINDGEQDFAIREKGST